MRYLKSVSIIAALGEHYEVADDEEGGWDLFCRGCDKGYHLNKPAPGAEVHPGNILALWDHAFSHDPKKAR